MKKISEMKIEYRPCRHCGTVVEMRHGRQKYCLECVTEKERQNQHRYYLRRHAEKVVKTGLIDRLKKRMEMFRANADRIERKIKKILEGVRLVNGKKTE